MSDDQFEVLISSQESINIQSKCDELTIINKKLLNDKEELTNNINNLSEENKKLKQIQSKLYQETKELHKAKEETETNHNEKQKNLMKNIIEKETIIENHLKTINKLKEKEIEQNNIIQIYERNLTSNENTIKSLQKSISETQNITNKETETENKTLKTEIESLKTQLSNLTLSQNKKESKIKTLTNKSKFLEEKLQFLEQTLLPIEQTNQPNNKIAIHEIREKIEQYFTELLLDLSEVGTIESLEIQSILKQQEEIIHNYIHDAVLPYLNPEHQINQYTKTK